MKKIGFGGKIGMNLGGLKIGGSVGGNEAEAAAGGESAAAAAMTAAAAAASGGFGTFGSVRKSSSTSASSSSERTAGRGGDEIASVTGTAGRGGDEIASVTGAAGRGDDEIASVMGFSGFVDKRNAGLPANQHKAKQFDLQAMLQESKKYAQSRTSVKNAKLDEAGKQTIRGQVEPTNTEEAIAPKKKNIGDKTDKTKVEVRKKEKSVQDDSDSDSSFDEDDEFIGPPIPKDPEAEGTSKTSNKSCDDDAGDDDDDDDVGEEEEEEETADPSTFIPNSHEIQLCHGNKAISALAIDPSGSRLASASTEYDVKFWDFAGMDSRLHSFRTIPKPCESHVIKQLEYSSTGDKLLVIPGSRQAKVMDRDGHEVYECKVGDPYITDPKMAKGHASGLNAGCWHPKIREEFLTAGSDGGMRVWYTTDPVFKGSRRVIKCKARTGVKTPPTACTYSQDGLLVAAGCEDGSIQMWDHRKSFVNVVLCLRGAHQLGSEVSAVTFAYDNHHVATRATDDTLKLWDIRNFKKAVNVVDGLFNRYGYTDCCFSPDDRLVVTGSSLNKGETTGKLSFFDRDSFEKVAEMEIGSSHVIRCLWHPKLNQMVVGAGDGVVRVYYSPDRSVRGAKLCVVKTKAKAKQINYISNEHIINPGSLRMFRPERQKSTRAQAEKSRKDPVASRRPDLPLGIKGTGGRTQSGGSTLHSYMAKQLGQATKDDHINPREAILRHAKESVANPYWVSPAYQKTQPTPIFQEVTGDEPRERITQAEPCYEAPKPPEPKKKKF